MILAELKQILETTGYPISYSHFKSSVNAPYITYLVPYSQNFIADDKVYHKINAVQIELYTDKKDLEAENKLESVLDAQNIPYDSTEVFIESENLFQKIYEVRLI